MATQTNSFIILPHNHARREPEVPQQSVQVARAALREPEARWGDVDLARELEVDDPASGLRVRDAMTRI